MKPILRVRRLNVAFPGRNREQVVLHDIDLCLHEQKILGLVGESGCGKSVLARTLLRLEAPARIISGSISLAGQELTTKSRRQMRQIQGRMITLALQDPASAMDPLFTMGSQLREVPAAGVTREKTTGAAQNARIYRELEEVGIGSPVSRCRQYPHQWSRGMLQRAQLVMAFSPGPRVVVLDEITSALDSTITLQILQQIRRLQARGRSAVILITHDLAVALEICDQVAVMHRGRIVESGPAEELLTRPGHPYTRMFVASLGQEDTSRHPSAGHRPCRHPVAGNPA